MRCKIILFYKTKDTFFKFFYWYVAFPLEQPAVNNAEPDFYLVHPWTMFRSIYKSYPVGRIMQKTTTAFHVFKDACLPLLPQFRIYTTGFCHEPHKWFGFMDIKAITDKCPGCFRIRVYQSFHGFYEIFFCPCGIQVWSFHTSWCNVKKTYQACRSMTYIFKFHFCTLPRLGQLIWIFMLQCLYACHFVGWDNMFPIPAGFLCLLVYPAYLIHFLYKRFGILLFFRGMEPVTDLMWL